ncbi:MAG: 2-amino-4-hydroxy-6-hydroxymethyldihydropteridine diphosphokinase [Aerococcus sp.]|nr:2-amino-4-hydroxy-6-hydroxymethyldihydropteridine diphosphokinase [Aerococcus sp.]
MTHIVYLSLGSNMGERVETLRDAITALNETAGTVTDVADRYVTSPVGYEAQDDFVNTAVRLETSLDAEALLVVIHQIEQDFHRERLIHWGPRTLDIDIIFFGETTYTSKTLTIPHAEAFNRLFVLVPIQQIYQEQMYRETLQQRIQYLLATTNQTIRKMTDDTTERQ